MYFRYIISYKFGSVSLHLNKIESQEMSEIASWMLFGFRFYFSIYSNSSYQYVYSLIF